MTRKRFSSLIRDFLQDTRGNYALMTIIAAVPLFGAVALAVDYSEMSRERQMTLNALDAAGIATARRILEGATDAETETYARQFFDANLGNINPKRATLQVDLPGSKAGGGLLKMSANLSYDPVFFGTFQSLMGKQASSLSFAAATEVKLKNTIEVALVLDNSGSMSDKGKGSGKARLTILKDAAKQLVDTMSAESAKMKQVDKPVQIGLVPFAASVNVGAGNRYEGWMDGDGISPIHHENFDWSTFRTRYGNSMWVEDVGGGKRARGKNWAEIGMENAYLTRFTLYDYVRRYTGQGSSTALVASWGGCVETRPYPYNVNDTAATRSTPATLFVPMFAPDEADIGSAPNSWWPDDAPQNRGALDRQRDMTKYVNVNRISAIPAGSGPNYGCTTTPVLPLKNVGTTAGINEVKVAIDAMRANGNTNVPEGMAWGWRVLSSQAPFTGGRSEKERGNDKVLIVLTDGENTYFTPTGEDSAQNRSTYGSFGYTGRGYNSPSKTRIFMNTSISGFSSSNYTKAMNQQFDSLCKNAKEANIVVMTVALDLDAKNTTEKAQIDALSACASNSRFRKDAKGNPEKLFWNSTGATLAEDFKRIADELSNLRIVS
ncbi:pilus assembly protein [Tianweitania populi]|uniref:VWFA domain-containing protein n=1 Tax=Tianweitania populi TaxID=1607949 RepID=A0A8J3DWM2_9HYPH|nr:pilus assembly protein [Tianweitania populi]GHD14103.1 hypothetical protein GCM10016234_19300 [Tianweitania populi]